MKIQPRDAERFALKPPGHYIAILVHGPDAGLVRERATSLVRSVVSDPSDPFRVAEIDGDTLADDPARLADEAAALSLMGGRRVVRVRSAGNAHAKIFERLLADPKGDALIVVEAPDLARGSLQRVFDDAGNAAALACYTDSERDLAGVVREALKEEGLAIEGQALEDCVARLGSDRGVTRREIEKLALYARGAKTVTSEHVRAVLGDESELRLDEVCDAAGEGDFARLDTALSRLWAGGLSPVAVLRQTLGHFQRLALVREAADAGDDVGMAIKKLRPPVHFSREKSFRAQAARLSLRQIEKALDQIYEAEALVKTTGVPGEATTGQALIEIGLRTRKN